MAITVSCLESPLLYGVNTIKPILPKGFKYIERPGHWLFAEGPDEKLYYVSFEKLYRMRVATKWDVIRSWIQNRGRHHLTEDQMFLDSRETIYIKQLQLRNEKNKGDGWPWSQDPHSPLYNKKG